jgi:hypothetical protein
MQIDYRFGRVSALTKDAIVAVGYRYDAEYRHPDHLESYVIGLYKDMAPLVMLGGTESHQDVWQSPTGRVFVANLGGALLINDDPRADMNAWARHDTDTSFRGIWGLADDAVFAWDVLDGRVFRHDGRAWGELPRVRAPIMAMHGIAPDLVMAVGEGVIARWDGTRWLYIVGPDNLWNGVHMVSADEIYLVAQNGELYEGSIYGVGPLAESDVDVLRDVAVQAGKVYVASEDTALKVLKDGDLELVDEDFEIECFDLDAREQLFAAGESHIHVLVDGRYNDLVSVRVWARLLDGKAPDWVPGIDMGDVVDLASSK